MRSVLITCMFFLLIGASTVSAEDWPMYRHDPAHTGFTDSKVPVAPNLLWKFSSGGVASAPAVVSGKAFFGSWNSKFFALDAENGKVIWEIETNKLIHTSSPTVVDGIVYFGTGGYDPILGELYAVNADNGEIIWVENFSYSIDSSVFVDEKMVYFATDEDNTVRAVYRENGTQAWSFKTGNWIYTSSPLVIENTLYIGSMDGYIYALDAKDGTLKWKYYAGGRIDSTPTAVGKIIYFGSGIVNGETWAVHALDTSTGSPIWIQQLDYPVRSSPAISGEKLFVGAGSEAVEKGENGIFYCMSLHDNLVFWSVPSYGDYVGHLSAAVTDNAVIITLSKKLLALDPDNGEEIWSRVIGRGNSIVADGKIYLGTAAEGSINGVDTGWFYCFGTPSPSIEVPVDNQTVSGIVKLQGTALGDSVQAVELNWGEGWVEADEVELDTSLWYSGEEDSTRYVNHWSYKWNTRSVSNGEYTLRARIRYTNGAYSDETIITLRVENPPLTWIEVVGITGLIVVAIVVVVWLKRR